MSVFRKTMVCLHALHNAIGICPRCRYFSMQLNQANPHCSKMSTHALLCPPDLAMAHTNIGLEHVDATLCSESRRICHHTASASRLTHKSDLRSSWHSAKQQLPAQASKRMQQSSQEQMLARHWKPFQGRKNLLTTYSYITFAQMLTPSAAWLQVRNFDADETQKLRTFKLFWRLYMYSPGQGTFKPVPAMPSHLPRQIRRTMETLHLINTAGMMHR